MYRQCLWDGMDILWSHRKLLQICSNQDFMVRGLQHLSICNLQPIREPCLHSRQSNGWLPFLQSHQVPMVDRGLDRRLQGLRSVALAGWEPVDRIPKLVSWQPFRRGRGQTGTYWQQWEGNEMEWWQKQLREGCCLSVHSKNFRWRNISSSLCSLRYI